MDRGVIVGGGLIAASFLVAVLLNRSAREEAVPTRAAPAPPARVCKDAAQRPPGARPVADEADRCDRPSAQPLKP
jgi:hypothetical protein